jgi:ribose-phosphate pyrophosphokinase
MSTPKIFTGSSTIDLAQNVSNQSKIPLGKIEIGKFSDGETDIWIKDKVNNSNVFVLQSTSNPVNDNIIELSFISDALKRSGAHKITAVIPYFGYSRKEKQSRSGEPISAKVVADLISNSGVNKIICLDLHADAIVGFFNVPVIHLTALGVLAKRVKKEKLKNLIVVSPDVGGVKRARNFASILNAPLVVIEKRRAAHKRDTLDILSMSGKIVGDTAVIIDDIISTGSTIIKSAKVLKEKGVKRIIVCATHGIFANNALNNLENSLIDKIFITDSINQTSKIKKMEIVSISEIIADCLKDEL